MNPLKTREEGVATAPAEGVDANAFGAEFPCEGSNGLFQTCLGDAHQSIARHNRG